MQLQILHPEVAFRDCALCQKYHFDEEGKNAGRMRLDKQGKPLVRPQGVRPLCQMDVGCPKGTADNPIELSPENVAAFDHFRRCQLQGNWPDDEIVLNRAVALNDLINGLQRRQAADDVATAVLVAISRSGLV